MRRLFASLCLIFALATSAGAQPVRDPYPVESLATVLGELHYLDFACQGRGSQTWRQAMVELLAHEAPARGAYRDRLIDNFNSGFRRLERRRPRCGAEFELERERLAREGRALSEQLRRTYLD
jgi:uncharacterized protein (TIGR02301 family)